LFFKTRYFNTRFVSYSVNIQPNIMQNYWKNMRENKKYFERTHGNFWIFFCFFLFLLLYNFFIIFIIIWAGYDLTQPYRPDLARSAG
jgi:hypothetical protein